MNSSAQQTLPTSLEGLMVELIAQRAYTGELRVEIQKLRHEVILLQRKLYGVRTEQTATVEQQTLFAELAAENAAVAG